MKKNLGQYFTKNENLKDKLFNLILNNPKRILEPSIGRGDLIEYIYLNSDTSIKFDMYEIDNTIRILNSINIYKNRIKYCDFLKEKIKRKYDTIIGNPPYIKTKTINTYIQFIIKCYNLLKNNGELIFIVPSIFFKATSSSNIINEMMKNGCFTHIFHPNNENLFEDASIDILIFRYCKNKELSDEILYNNQKLYINNINGILTFTELKAQQSITGIYSIKIIKDIFEVYVGLVSGKDKILKNEKLGNIMILNSKNKINKYILISEFPTKNEELNLYMLKNKDELLNRKIKKFTEKNWFHFGSPRNIKIMKNDLDKECIYIYNLTRKKEVAFKSKIQYFGGNLIMLKLKENINLNLDDILNKLNSDDFKKNYMYSGRFKIGHKQISNAILNLNTSDIC